MIWHFFMLKFYSDGLMKWNEKMSYEEEKLNFLKKKLNSIYEPLRVFDSKRKNVINPNERPRKIGEIMLFYQFIYDFCLEIQRRPETSTLHKITKVILIFYAILAALTCWMRAEFFDVEINEN